MSHPGRRWYSALLSTLSRWPLWQRPTVIALAHAAPTCWLLFPLVALATATGDWWLAVPLLLAAAGMLLTLLLFVVQLVAVVAVAAHPAGVCGRCTTSATDDLGGRFVLWLLRLRHRGLWVGLPVVAVEIVAFVQPERLVWPSFVVSILVAALMYLLLLHRLHRGQCPACEPATS